MMTTSNQSNLTSKIVEELTLLKQRYTTITINTEEIQYHITSICEGKGIRLLNSIDSNSLGAFIFYNNGQFVLLIDHNGFATTKKISEDEAISMLILFYSCRALTMVPKLYSEIIIEKNKILNDCIKQISLRQS